MGGVASNLLRELASAPKETAAVITLTGNLGAGKTTLVQSIARALGVSEVVTSPTFVVMKSYQTTHAVFTTLVHIDAYRIDDVAELEVLHFKELLATQNTLICIEWPERIMNAIPNGPIEVSLDLNPAGTRTISYYGY